MNGIRVKKQYHLTSLRGFQTQLVKMLCSLALQDSSHEHVNIARSQSPPENITIGFSVHCTHLSRSCMVLYCMDAMKGC